jgi:hypothetical protein
MPNNTKRTVKMKFTKIFIMDGATPTQATPEIWATIKTAISQKLTENGFKGKFVTVTNPSTGESYDKLIKVRFLVTCRYNTQTQRRGNYLGYDDWCKVYSLVNGVLTDFNISCNVLCSDSCHARIGQQAFTGYEYEAQRPTARVEKWKPIISIAQPTSPQTPAPAQQQVKVKKEKKDKGQTAQVK